MTDNELELMHHADLYSFLLQRLKQLLLLAIFLW